MDQTCRRLIGELQRGMGDPHRLLEIETIIRLLVPHLIRAVAEAIHAGKAQRLGDAGERLVAVRSCLGSIAEDRSRGTVHGSEEKLLEALSETLAILAALD